MPKIIRESDLREPDPPVPPRQLCYEGGDVIIYLGNGPDAEMVLPSEVLRESGDFFNMGSKAAWSGKAEIITDPKDGQENKILRYKLAYKYEDGVVVLDSTSSDDTAIDKSPVNIYRSTNFFLSKMASGFFPRDPRRASDFKSILIWSQDEHKTAFGLLLEQRDIDGEVRRLSFENIANIVAYTEYYGFFHMIARPLRAILLQQERLWEDVKDHYCFHLGLALKLRCSETYEDALRHYIGSGLQIYDLKHMNFDAEAILRIMMKREKLQNTLDELNSKIHRLALAPYMAHADIIEHQYDDTDDEDETADEPGPLVRTSYLSSTAKPTNVFDHSKAIARSIVLEFLTLHLHAEEHWSYYRSEGMFFQSSLRNVCNLVVEARQNGAELDLFDHNAAKKYVEMSNTIGDHQRPYMVHWVEDELKDIINQIANLAWPYIAPADFVPVRDCSYEHPTSNMSMRGQSYDRGGGRSLRRPRGYKSGPSGRGGCGVRGHNHDDHENRTPTSYFSRQGLTANYDKDCHYFTCVELMDEGDIPWEKDFEAFKVKELEPASRKWLVTIGLAKEDEKDKYSKLFEGGWAGGVCMS